MCRRAARRLLREGVRPRRAGDEALLRAHRPGCSSPAEQGLIGEAFATSRKRPAWRRPARRAGPPRPDQALPALCAPALAARSREGRRAKKKAAFLAAMTLGYRTRYEYMTHWMAMSRTPGPARGEGIRRADLELFQQGQQAVAGRPPVTRGNRSLVPRGTGVFSRRRTAEEMSSPTTWSRAVRRRASRRARTSRSRQGPAHVVESRGGIARIGCHSGRRSPASSATGPTRFTS